MASKEPRRITRDYAMMMKKVKGTDKEINRVLMLTDFESGNPMPFVLKQMQHEILPSVSTPNLKISYELEAAVLHEGALSSSQDLPSLKFPLHVTLDPQGPFDMGREGLEQDEAL